VQASKVAVVGLGYWGPNYVRVLAELAEAEPAYACDLDEARFESVRVRHPGLGFTTSLDEVLADDSVEAVVVSTPTSTHTDVALAALEAGKHVLCEKPLAQTVAECDRLIEAAERTGRVLMVGHTFIFNPAVQRMRELVESGALGQVLYCHATRTGLGPIRQDVNALWDLAPHDISILLHLTGAEPAEVSAAGESFLQQGTEDVVFVNLRLEGPVFTNVHLSWLDPYKVRKVTVVGDERMAVFDDISADEKLRLFDKGASYEGPAEEARDTDYGEYRAVVRDGDIVIPKLAAAEPLKEQMRHFLECCREGATPVTDGAAARRVVAVLEGATASLASGGAPVALS
jgi:predicted dehydrogenase